MIVSKGMEHCPVATEEAYVLILEPKTAFNTRNNCDDRMIEEFDRT